MDEKWTLNALWIMFHDLMDFRLGPPQIGEPKVNVTWSPIDHEPKKPWLVQKKKKNCLLLIVPQNPLQYILVKMA
jgi:hypothetical protein